MPKNKEPSEFEKQLISGLKQAVAICRGEMKPARETVWEIPEDGSAPYIVSDTRYDSTGATDETGNEGTKTV